jgi:hypothetical protein
MHRSGLKPVLVFALTLCLLASVVSVALAAGATASLKVRKYGTTSWGSSVTIKLSQFVDFNPRFGGGTGHDYSCGINKSVGPNDEGYISWYDKNPSNSYVYSRNSYKHVRTHTAQWTVINSAGSAISKATVKVTN